MGFLKDLATAFKPSNIKAGLDAARNPPDPAQIEAVLATLTPEQRAAYEANMAQVHEAMGQSQAAWLQARDIEARTRPLWGPAGEYVHGPPMDAADAPESVEARVMQDGVLDVASDMRAKNKGQFKAGLKQSFGIENVEQIDDPAQRAQVAADERAARDAARAPYRAERAVAVTIDRIATRGKTQVAELIEHLAQAGLSPDRVHGVYRVPDRISQALTPHSEKGRVVEWAVVHGGDAAGGSGARPVATSFVAEEQWVARRVGEPSVLDEDLAIAFCLDAGIGPEHCFGVARVSEFRSLRGEGSEDSSGDIRTLVKGVVAIHPEESSGAFDRLLAATPLPLPFHGSEGIYTEVLNWEAVAKAVHLKVHHPPPVPSPFPYLPATPGELLTTYLEVVGVAPSDCYSAQATVDRPSPLIQGGFMSTNIGPKQPCADGEDRMRSHGCEHVVVAYRDRPEYAAGRDRWTAYEGEVLYARLNNGVRLRPEVKMSPRPDEGVPTSILRAAARIADKIDRIDEIGVEKLAPYRYCWPPVE